jgi:hypothetical protein
MNRLKTLFLVMFATQEADGEDPVALVVDQYPAHLSGTALAMTKSLDIHVMLVRRVELLLPIP